MNLIPKYRATLMLRLDTISAERKKTLVVRFTYLSMTMKSDKLSCILRRSIILFLMYTFSHIHILTLSINHSFLLALLSLRSSNVDPSAIDCWIIFADH